jgi:hypothetical protein
MAKLKIKPVNHGTTKADINRYCGAAVVSAITGMTTGEAARLVRHLSGVRSVKGTTIRQIRDAFNACGVQFNRFEPVKFGMRFNRTNGVTLTGWLRGTVKYRNAERVFLVVAGQHWQLVQGRRYVCGLTKEIVSIKDKKVKRRARVSYVYELTAPDGITIPHVAKKPKNPNSGATASKARRLAKELGIEIEIEHYYSEDLRRYWLGGYAEGDGDYVDLGVIETHFADSWSEVVDTLQAIKDYKSQAIAA